jgi:hypothetical protein
MTSIVHQPNQSPFDAIRHFDENGNEFWMARELMPILGYKQWRRFSDVVSIAQENLETVTSSTIEHFLPVETKNVDSDGNRLKGRTGLDYKLSRLACYHVALSCDSRGNEQVKMAKHYFAVKTREAETVIPAMTEALRHLELQNEILEKQLRMRELDNTMTILHGKEYVLTLLGKDNQLVETEIKTLEVIDDRHNVRWEGQTMTQFKDFCNKRLGTSFKTGAEIKRILDKHGLVAQVPRTIPQDYIPKELVEEAYKVVKSKLSQSRQLLLGE